jgi:hypothetical protein
MIDKEHLRMIFPLTEYVGRLNVVQGIIYERTSLANLLACLIGAIAFVDLLDKLAVQKMERNVLGASAGALAAVSATAGHVEGTDDVEHLLFKAVGGRPVLHTGARIVKHASLASASGTSIAASIATDTTGKLILPEGKALIGSHSLKTSYLVKAIRLENLTLLSKEAIIGYVLFALAACALLKEYVGRRNRNSLIVDGMYEKICALALNGSDSIGANSLDLTDIGHTLAGDTNGIYLFTVKAMLRQKLIEAIGVAGLQEYQDLSLGLTSLGYQIFRKVDAAEIVIDEVTAKGLLVFEQGGGYVIIEFTLLPAEHGGNRSVLQALYGYVKELSLIYFLHLKSSNLLFSPSLVTFSTKSFMVAANFAPSAAETHSTRVRSRSIPRKSSIENSIAIRRRA